MSGFYDDDWSALFILLSNHTIWKPNSDERQCATCGPTDDGGQQHLTDAILAAGWVRS